MIRLLGNLHGWGTDHGGETGRIAGSHEESCTESTVDALHYTSVLNDVLSEVVIAVNYIKTTEPLKSALITLLCCFTVKRDGSPALKVLSRMSGNKFRFFCRKKALTSLPANLVMNNF